MTGPLSEICIATDRFHEVIEIVQIQGEPDARRDNRITRRLCQNCGLLDTYIQEEHGPDSNPPRLPPPEPVGYYEERMKRRMLK